MALTSSSTTDNMSVGETCINGPKQHTVVDNYAPPTVVRNLMGEFHGVTITQTNGRQRMKSHQNYGEQKDSRWQLHNFECKKIQETPYSQNIKLPPLKNPPDLLKNLLTGNTHRDKHFRDNIRAYNSSLAFASLCLTGQEFTFKHPGPYCYRINGQLYHVLSQMQPEHGQQPTFSQIYIYDCEHELDYCMKPFTGLDA